MTKAEAEKYRSIIEEAVVSLDDKRASEGVTFYPTLKADNTLIKAGTRINFGGELLKAAVDLWDIEENTPENAPTLWEEIQYHEGIRIIPETITATTAFALGELGYWKADGKTYKSLIDANVYTPEVYPDGWEKV